MYSIKKKLTGLVLPYISYVFGSISAALIGLDLGILLFWGNQIMVIVLYVRGVTITPTFFICCEKVVRGGQANVFFFQTFIRQWTRQNLDPRDWTISPIWTS